MTIRRMTLAALLLAGTTLAANASELRIGLENDPDVLDPDVSRLFIGRIVFTALCDKLVDVNEKLEIVPQLATEWSLSEDNRALTFKLREGVTFHDGTPFDAEAVKANIARSQTLEGSVRKSEIASIESVDVVSPLEVRLNLKAPDATLLAQLSDRAGMMMSPAAFAEGKNFAEAPICSGPFKFKNRVAQDRVELEKFEEYWNADAIKLDKVTYLSMSDASVRLANLQSGDIDIVNQMQASDIPTVEGNPDLAVAKVTALGYQGLTYNMGPNADGPLGRDARVRHALSLAIDREAINQVVFNGAMPPAGQPFGPDSPYHDPDFPAPTRDVEKAKALLAEAGVTTPIVVDVQTPNTQQPLQVMQMVQAMAAEVGFDIRIVPKEFATLIDDAAAGNFQVSQQGWSGRIDPDGNLHQFVTTGAGFNDSKYSNPEVDRLLNEARTVTDVEARKKLYHDAMVIIEKDQPLTYLYFLAWLYGIDKDVEGFKPYPDGMIRLEGVSKAG